MIRALYTAASGMSAQQMNLDTIANNLANSSTTGFRQLRMEFQDMVYQNMVTPGAAQSQSTVSAGLQIGLGTKPVATEVINTEGPLNETDNQYDVAISGSGFFQVQMPDGSIAYTRAGQFHLNSQGTIVTTDGDPLIPTITIPTNNKGVTITPSGVVNATISGQKDPSQLGQINWPPSPTQVVWKAWDRRAAGHAQLRRPGASGNPVGPRGRGTAAAKLPGKLECGCGDHVCADGAGAAGLRIEFEGHQGRRRHVLPSQQYDALIRGQGSGVRDQGSGVRTRDQGLEGWGT